MDVLWIMCASRVTTKKGGAFLCFLSSLFPQLYQSKLTNPPPTMPTAGRELYQDIERELGVRKRVLSFRFKGVKNTG